MVLQAGDVVFSIGADLADFSKELQAAKVNVKAFGDNLTKIGKDAGTSLDASLGKTPKEMAKKFDESAKAISANLKSVSMSAGLFGASVLGAFGTAAKKASDYQSSLNQVRILGVKDMDLVDEAVRKVAKTFGTDLAETATVAKDAISTFGTEGQGLADSLVFVEQSAKAATAGYVGLTDAAKATTSILKVFNLNTNQTLEVMDALKVATDLGITDMQRFAPEVSKLGVQFQSAGMDFKEMVSALGAMTLVEQDVSRDTMFLTNLLKVLGGGNQEASKAAKEMGIEFSASALETKKLSGMVEMVTKATQGNKDALRRLFPDMDAYNGYLTFARVNSGDYQKILEKVNHSLGETDKAYQDVIKHDPTFHLKQMKAGFLDMSISIGEKLIPSMMEWVSTIQNATKGLDDLEESIPGVTDFTVNMGLKMGEAAIAIAAITYTGAKAIETLAALRTAMAWIAGLGAAGALGVGGVAVGGIGYGLYSLYDTFSKYGPEIERNAKDMVSAFKNLFTGADDSLGKFEATTKQHLDGTAESMDAFEKDLDEKIGHSTWIDAYKRNADEAEKEFGRWAGAIEENISRVKEITITVEPILQEMADLSAKVLGQAEFPGLSVDLSAGTSSNVDGVSAGKNLFTKSLYLEQQLKAMAEAAWNAAENTVIVAGKLYGLKDASLAAGEGMAVVAGETGKANESWLLGSGAIGKLTNGVGESENVIRIFGQTIDLATEGVKTNTGAVGDSARAFDASEWSVRNFLQTFGLYEGSLKRGSDQLDKAIEEYERMQEQIKELTSTIEQHAKAVERAEQTYNNLAAARGEDSEEAKKQFEVWQQSQKALEGEQKALEDLQRKSQSTRERIVDMSEGIRAEAEDLKNATGAADEHAKALDRVGNAAQAAGNKYDIFGRLVEEAGYKYDIFGRKVGKVTEELEHFSSRFAGSVTESISDFEEIYEAASIALGGTENLIWQWKKYVVQTLRQARAGMEVEVLTLSDYIRKILGITEQQLASQTEQVTRKFQLGYEDWLALAMEYSDQHNRIMNEFWKVYASTQSLSLDKAADVMRDYYQEMVDLLEKASEATEQSNTNSTKSLTTLSTAVKKLGSDWSTTTKTIVASAKDAYEAILKVSTATSNKTKAYASGGITDHPMVMVGERGPELAALPVGTRILSHEDMMRAASMGVMGYADGGVIPPGATRENILDYVNAYINSQIANVQSMPGMNAITHLPKITEAARAEWIEKLNAAKERYAKFIDYIGTTTGGAVSHEWSASTVENNLMRDMATLRLSMLSSSNQASTVSAETSTLFSKAASTAAAAAGDNRIDGKALQKVYEEIFGSYSGALEWGLGKRKTGTIDRPGGGYFSWEASEDRALLSGAKPESDHMLWDPLRGYWVAPTEANAAKAIAKLKFWYALKRIQETPASVVGFAEGGLVGGKDWLIQSLNDLRKKAPKGGTYFVSDFPVSTVNVPSDSDPQIGYWDVVSTVVGGTGSSSGTGGSGVNNLAATELPWMPQEGNELIDLGIQKIWDRLAAEQSSSGSTGNDPYAGLVMTSGGQTYVKMPLFWGSGAGGYQWEPIEKADQLVFTNHYKLPFPSYAEGGVTGSRVVLVGERGPELAALPMGTRVMSHEAMMQAVAGYADGGIVGSRAVKALAGGLADISGMGSTGNSTTLTINAPLVQVDRVNASDAHDVDKFVKQVSDVFKRQLSSLGLSLNTVGRA